jgi:hypothetical protein
MVASRYFKKLIYEYAGPHAGAKNEEFIMKM